MVDCALRQKNQFINLKIIETRFTTIQTESPLLLLNKRILFTVSVPHLHVNTLNYVLVFYPVMNVS